MIMLVEVGLHQASPPPPKPRPRYCGSICERCGTCNSVPQALWSEPGDMGGGFKDAWTRRNAGVTSGDWLNSVTSSWYWLAGRSGGMTTLPTSTLACASLCPLPLWRSRVAGSLAHTGSEYQPDQPAS